jgi:4-hydroxy-tetrahydrodipicolinate synthase
MSRSTKRPDFGGSFSRPSHAISRRRGHRRSRLLSIIDFAIESKVDGVVYPGVASEVDTLTLEERRRQVELLAEHIAGRIPIIIGASDPDPKASARHVAQAAEIGASAAMVMAPLALGN